MTIEDLDKMIKAHPAQSCACELCGDTGRVKVTGQPLKLWARGGGMPALLECWLCGGTGEPQDGSCGGGCEVCAAGGRCLECDGAGQMACCWMCEIGNEQASALEVEP